MELHGFVPEEHHGCYFLFKIIRDTSYGIFGSPPGYIGSDEPNVLDQVAKNPRAVIIFDELDKAHPQIIKSLMAILDEGKCAANKELSDGSRVYNLQRN